MPQKCVFFVDSKSKITHTGILVIAVVLLFGGLGNCQSEPNLETGFKPYGSYAGTDLDTVSLMNGNVTFHIPFPAEYPERGTAIHEKMMQILHAKGWHVVPNSGTTTSHWEPNRELMGSSDNMHPSHTRMFQQFTVSGQTFRSVSHNALVTWDGATHNLMDVSNGQQLSFEAVDGSGWHVSMSNPDQYGIPQTSVITDRAGTQYTVSQYGTVFGAFCGDTQSGGFSSPGGHPPLLYPNSPGAIPDASSISCQMAGIVTSAVDSNGNIFSMNQNAWVDTMGRSTSSTPPGFYPFGFNAAETLNPNPPGCFGAYSFEGSGTISYPGFKGPNQILICYADFPIQTNFGVSGIEEYPTSTTIQKTVPLIASIVLPDGSSWTFNYDLYGNPVYISLPLGGSISYQWATIAFPVLGTFTPVSRAVTQRTITDNNGHSYVWKYQWLVSQNNPTGANGTFTNVVTDPLGNDTTHVFTNYLSSFYETSTITYRGAYTSGQPVKQVDTGYQVTTAGDERDQARGTVLPNSFQTTAYPSRKRNLIQKSYDLALTDPTSGTTSYGAVVTEKIYDWGQGSPGPLLRETDTTYEWQVNNAYVAAHFLDLPATVVVKDGSGCALSETDYSYDEPEYLSASNISTQHVSPTSSVRGNLTTVTKWLAASGSCNPKSGTALISHINSYDTGEVHQQIDALGRTTTYTYDPVYVGAFPTRTCLPQTGTASHCVSGTYDFTTGLLTSVTNENATTPASGNTRGDTTHTTVYDYDLMSRLTSASFPPDPVTGTQPQTNFHFPLPITLPFTVTKTRSITPSLTDSITSTYDGLGRVYKTQHPTSTGTAEVDTVYDGLDHVVSVTNPYFSTSDPTFGTVRTQYDPLGRPTQITEQDGSVKSVAYNVSPLQATSGDCTQTTDEANSTRLTCSDALSRLIEVHEPGNNFGGTPASGTINIAGSLKSLSGVGATGATYATTQITISGTDHATVIAGHQQCLPPPGGCFFIPGSTTYDSGTVKLTVNGISYSNSFTQTAPTDALQIAQAITGQMTSDPNVTVLSVTSGTNSATITLQAKSSGTSGNSIPFSTSYSSQFSPPSFTATPASANLAGGTNSNPGITVWDQGTVSLSVGGYSTQVCYGKSGQCPAVPSASFCPTGDSTPAQIACMLAYNLNQQSPPFNINAPGASISIVWKSNTQAGNVGLSVTSNGTQTTYFGTPSFYGCGTTCISPTQNPQVYSASLTGGLDPTGPGLDHNFFVTQYSYDALGNLLQVTQKGDPTVTASSQWRVRTFTYDSLSRLLTAHNPESGSISYSYDADGNLLQKTSPAPNQTGSATQTISYCYDELNRATGKAYSAQTCPVSSPAVAYSYDSGANAKGKLTGITDQAGSASYSYDVLGRLAGETRTIAGVPKSVSYGYNLDGSIAKITYPSGASVTYTSDSAGRMLSAVDIGNNINYVSGATYQADGQITGVVSGNSGAFAGISGTFSYNKRLQPINISAASPSQTVFAIGYDFHVGNGTSGADNGNVWNIYNFRDRTRDQSFTYDLLNRVTGGWSAASTGALSWGENYSIDAWGNVQINPMAGKAHGGYFPNASDVTNRVIGFGYDAAGNITNGQYVYDPENRILSAAGVTYTYDANGNRVEKSGGTVSTLYWYGAPGIIAESDLSGVLKSEYVFFNGKRIARVDRPGNTVHYYLSDHLNSTSIVVNSAGAVEQESDYSPFGTEYAITNTGLNHYKFTGKERDTESQLDYFGARYYSSLMARFGSPDPVFIDIDRAFDPQRLNLYGYAGANPLRFVDETGNAPIDPRLRDQINSLRQTTYAFARSEIAAYRAGGALTGTYSAGGSYRLQEAANAQQNLDEHGDLQGLFDPQGQYDNALSNLVGYLEPEVKQSLLSALSGWANDPNTNVEQLKAAQLDILQADGVELPDPGKGNRRLKEFARTAWEKAWDEFTDSLFEGASVAKKIAQTAMQTLDVDHQFRQDSLQIIGGAVENKGSNSGGSHAGPCRTSISNDRERDCSEPVK